MIIHCQRCLTPNPSDSRFCKECAAPLSDSGLPSFPRGPQAAASVPSSPPTKTLLAPSPGLRRGALFAGRYEVIEELGKGGMGAVYRVEDKEIQQEIALKLISPEIASDQRTIARFRQELKTARMISHRNVCRMFDLGESQGT